MLFMHDKLYYTKMLLVQFFLTTSLTNNRAPLRQSLTLDIAIKSLTVKVPLTVGAYEIRVHFAYGSDGWSFFVEYS